MKSYQELFAELKRRKVFKVSAVYGVVSFGLIQVADPLTDALLLPDTFLTYVVAILLLGFPLALVLAWAFEVTPEGVQRTGAAAPGEIEAIVSAPASQRWPAGLLALVGAGALLAGGWWVGQRTGGDSDGPAAQAALISGVRLVDLAEDTRPSIAVLPFADMSSAGDQEYFGDGMAEEIINTLVKVRDLRVAGRTSAFAYKGESKDLREIGRELGVAYIVEGSVRKEGDQLRITAQLIDAADGSHLWSDRYDYALTAASVFQIQSEIAEAIAGALTVPLGLDNASDLVTPTGDLEAYDLYLAGRARLRARAEGVFEAIELFKAAVARDSMWAPAWAGLADATSLQVWYPAFTDKELPFDETLAEAEIAARRALELNPQNPTALVALGSIHRDRWEWAEAERNYRLALDLDPDNPEAHQQYAEWLHKQGRVAEAVASIDRAAALDPSAVRIFQLQHILKADGRLDEAEDVVRWASEQPIGEFFALKRALRRIDTRRAFTEGRYEDMIVPWGEVATPGDSLGWGEYVRALVAGRLDLVPDTLRDPRAIAIWLAASGLIVLNEPDLAVEQLIERLSTGYGRLFTEQLSFPYVDSIRSHPVLREFMTSAGLNYSVVQRTPVEDRVRPAILRQADAAAAAAEEPTP